MRKKGAELVFLGELPDGEEVIDFYHAAGHLDTALAAAYGDTHPKRRAQFEKQRHVLLEDYKGVEKVIRSLVHLRDTYPRRKKIARELKYFRRNRHRMRYAALKEQGLPIGSGVTEAACKTLSNATHEEVRNAMGRARRPSHSILPRSRAEQSLRASLDPARTYLQGGGYDSRQCRADTQLAMIGVSMRVTPKRKVAKRLYGFHTMRLRRVLVILFMRNSSGYFERKSLTRLWSRNARRITRRSKVGRAYRRVCIFECC